MIPAICVENLGKRYRLLHAGQAGQSAYRTLRDDLVHLISAPLRRLGRDSNNSSEDFWALKGVEFEVRPGEAMGIIGRNGAGKSTLLKILSRITKPTTGRVEIRGRVASLLEVGTGFHPELTGRENIYLNGSILGMAHREIRRGFDEIVAFSGIERFLDTPMKRFSSGMQVRLAFAVGAHLQPEVLVIDEVLAVGDFEFQKKCLGKMGDVVKSGRTVLFVSHNLDAVARLTQRAVLLRNGEVAAVGRSLDVIKSYLATGNECQPEWRVAVRDPTKVVTFVAVRAANLAGEILSHFDAGQPIEISIDFQVSTRTSAQIAFRLVAGIDEQVLFTSGHGDPENRKCTFFTPGDYRSRCRVPANFLRPGMYHLLLAANKSEGGQFDLIEQAISFEVTSVGSLVNHDQRFGVLAPLLEWHTEPR